MPKSPALPPQAPFAPPPPPISYHQVATQQVGYAFQAPKGYRLKKRRRWPWILLALLVIGGVASAAAKPKTSTTAKPKASTTATSPVTPQATAPAVAPAAALGVGSTDTTSGLQVTLIAVTDPWVSTNQFEQPSAGNRYVAIELSIVNTTAETQSFSTLLGLEVVDSLGQHWNPAFAGFNLPQLDASLAPGAMVRGSQVFDVPTGSTGLSLVVTGSLTATGITFLL